MHARKVTMTSESSYADNRRRAEGHQVAWPTVLIVGICLPFLFSGIAELLDPAGAVAEFSGIGLPAPALAVGVTVLVQLGGSGAVIFFDGGLAALGALGLAAFTVAATLMAHAFWTLEMPARLQQINIFVEHLSITFALGFVALWKWRQTGTGR